MRAVSSRQHPIVRTYRELATTADPDGGRVLLDGTHIIREALAASLSFESVAVAASHVEADSEAGVLARTLEDAGVEVIAAGARAFSAMSPVRAPGGIVGIVHRSPATAEAIASAVGLFALLVTDVQDPGNLGSLIRVAEAAGVSGVIVCGESANPFSWKAVRGSMGSILRMPTARRHSIRQTLRDIRATGARTIAAVPRGGRDPETASWSGRIALLLGGEGHGLEADVVADCDEAVSVPMASPVESLNVATAGAVLVYAAHRARR